MRPLATALIKRQICKAIEDGIRSAFEMADAQIGLSSLLQNSLQALISLARNSLRPEAHERVPIVRRVDDRSNQVCN